MKNFTHFLIALSLISFSLSIAQAEDDSWDLDGSQAEKMDFIDEEQSIDSYPDDVYPDEDLLAKADFEKPLVKAKAKKKAKVKSKGKAMAKKKKKMNKKKKKKHKELDI